MLGRHKAQSGSQMSLAHAGWAEEHHVLRIFQEAHGGQFIDLTLVECEPPVVLGIDNHVFPLVRYPVQSDLLPLVICRYYSRIRT